MRLTGNVWILMMILLATFLVATTTYVVDATEVEEDAEDTNTTAIIKEQEEVEAKNKKIVKDDISAGEETIVVEEEESIATIERNPDYESDDEEEIDYEESDDDEVYEDDDYEKEDSKPVIDVALERSRKVSRKTLEFVKKNRIKITVALALIAFRREISSYLLDKIAPVTGKDPVTGKIQQQWLKMDPTSVLKIVVFIDIMRQLQGAGKKRDPLIIAFLLLGARNPIVSSILSKTILQENNAFVPQPEQHYTFEKLNERYKKDSLALQKAANHKVKPEVHLPSLIDLQTKDKQYLETVIVLDLIGVDSARIDRLRDEVSFLLHQHREQVIPYSNRTEAESNMTKNVEIVVLLESPGGSASDFALASQQLLRLRNEPGISVTVCVDKVAASGGYMIACASTPGRLLAAPFAVLGSIGVVGQAVNVQKTLEGWGVKPMVFRGGKDKAPVGLIGDVSYHQKKSIQTMVDDTHKVFKQHVVRTRPVLANKIDKVSTGKIWLGASALEIGLIDHLVTSDEYIGHRIQSGARMLKLVQNHKRRTLFGGQPQRSGFEGSIISSISQSLKQRSKQALMKLADKIDVPADAILGMVPLSAKATSTSLAASSSYTTVDSAPS